MEHTPPTNAPQLSYSRVFAAVRAKASQSAPRVCSGRLLLTPFRNLCPDFVADLPHARPLFFVRSGQGRRIGKTPVHTFGDARENWTFLSAGFIANGDDVGKKFSRFEDIEHRLRFLLRNIDADFLHRFDHERIQRSRSSPALCASKTSPHRWLSQASAIWLRALLWTQMKRTFDFI